jgi:hypothetical protein
VKRIESKEEERRWREEESRRGKGILESKKVERGGEGGERGSVAGRRKEHRGERNGREGEAEGGSGGSTPFQVRMRKFFENLESRRQKFFCVRVKPPVTF